MKKIIFSSCFPFKKDLTNQKEEYAALPEHINSEKFRLLIKESPRN